MLLRTALQHPRIKLLVFALSLLPLVWLVWGAANNALGANPAEYLIRASGDWTLRFLCLTLAVTPVRQLFQLHALAKLRRMLGLFVFFYAVLHALCYAWLDMGWDLSDIVRDVGKRPFILVGVLCLGLLTPLALTSWSGAVRWLGAARWRRVHQAVYLIAPLVILHFYWMRASKHRLDDVGVYGAWLAVVLLWRVARVWRTKAL